MRVTVFKIVILVGYIVSCTLQEMCCGFLLSREMWYRKSVLLSTGAGCSEIKIDEKMLKILFVLFYLENPLGLESEIRPLKCLDISSL